MKIMTDFVPELQRWRAIDDSTYDGSERDPIGWGKTQAEAIADLQADIEMKEGRFPKSQADLLLERVENARDIAQLQVAQNFERDASGKIVAAPASFIIGYLSSSLVTIEHDLRQRESAKLAV